MTQLYVVTGASSGIGLALATSLAKKKIKVLAIARSEIKLKELQQQFPDEIYPLVADLSTLEGIGSVLDYVGQNKMEVLGLVNNAGAAAPVAFIQDLDIKEWHQHININLDAPIFLSIGLVPKFVRNGRIVNITTGAAGSAVVEGLAAYAMTKTALNTFTRYLSAELKNREILVAAAHPGTVKTELVKKMVETALPTLEIIRFQEYFEKENKYLDVNLSAKFLSWLLLDAEDDLYTGEIIGIYNKQYQPLWHDKEIPSPYPNGIEPP